MESLILASSAARVLRARARRSWRRSTPWRSAKRRHRKSTRHASKSSPPKGAVDSAGKRHHGTGNAGQNALQAPVLGLCRHRRLTRHPDHLRHAAPPLSRSFRPVARARSLPLSFSNPCSPARSLGWLPATFAPDPPITSRWVPRLGPTFLRPVFWRQAGVQLLKDGVAHFSSPLIGCRRDPPRNT